LVPAAARPHPVGTRRRSRDRRGEHGPRGGRGRRHL